MNTIHLNRLRGDYSLLTELDAQSDLIDIAPGAGSPPEAYRVVYRCKGVVGVQPDWVPIMGSEHVMDVYLPVRYPAIQPQFVWRSPIFHPNIHATDGRVCIDRWFAASNLADIIIMIGDIVCYKNYNPNSPLNTVAAGWAKANARLFPVDNRSWRMSERRAVPSLSDLIELGAPEHVPQPVAAGLVIELGPPGGQMF